MGQIKSGSNMKESDFYVFEKIGNSTLPSYHNLDCSILQNEVKLNRYRHSPHKEEESQQIWRLKTDLFEKTNAVTRPYCKTDRL